MAKKIQPRSWVCLSFTESLSWHGHGVPQLCLCWAHPCRVIRRLHKQSQCSSSGVSPSILHSPLAKSMFSKVPGRQGAGPGGRCGSAMLPSELPMGSSRILLFTRGIPSALAPSLSQALDPKARMLLPLHRTSWKSCR